MICQWCGDEHPVEALCARAQRGMTRRSFLFLTSAALVAQALPTLPSFQLQEYSAAFTVTGPVNIGQIVAEEWNRVIGQQLLDNIFDEPIERPMRDALRRRLKGK